MVVQGILPIDLAKKLKEKGFNEETFFSYNGQLHPLKEGA